MENQILKSGYISREVVILENDDPGGVFEFSLSSRGPYRIKVSAQKLNPFHDGTTPNKNTESLGFLICFKGRRIC